MNPGGREVTFYLDRRYGASGRWKLGVRPETAMRIPDEWLLSVFFLGVDVERGGVTQTRYAGTGFYFRHQNEFDPNLRRLYLVTAAHNIHKSRDHPGPLYVRVNTEDGGSVRAEVDRDRWSFHADPSVDLAVLPVAFGTGSGPPHQAAYVESDFCLSDAARVEFDIGVGSDLTVVGLFRHREGITRNIPIARAGRLAAMPGELIGDGTGPPYHAYLADLVSFGGLSGSPVFVHALAGPQHRHPRSRRADGRIESHTEWNQPSFLLGVVRSHWDEPPEPPFDTVPRHEWINLGIAAVTPIEPLFELLDREDLKAQRRSDAEAARKAGSASV